MCLSSKGKNMKLVYSVNMWNGIRYVRPSQASEFWTREEADAEWEKFTSLKWEAKVKWFVCSHEVEDDYILEKASESL
jgi:hypothetical protein